MPRSSFTAEEWKRHEAPTRDNQVWHANRVLVDEGLAVLARHAAVSRDNRCGCGTCFCCAALFVERQEREYREKNGGEPSPGVDLREYQARKRGI